MPFEIGAGRLRINLGTIRANILLDRLDLMFRAFVSFMRGRIRPILPFGELWRKRVLGSGNFFCIGSPGPKRSLGLELIW